ncbi:hypothetical protein AYI68_g6882 [Smittium mucronatum]|uniref:Uncharacterized protein n=1 Tax=Smittium mucronatum TaxID=133383 RepID=A0A1R0GQC9_9FUNG|nr:hypothetical protein AYI68_g6882 [Smittium mucronatum]
METGYQIKIERFMNNPSQSIFHLGIIISYGSLSYKDPSPRFPDDYEMPGELHQDNTGYFINLIPWETNAETSVRSTYHFPIFIKDMDFNGNSEDHTRAIESDISRTAMEFGNLVSGSTGSLHFPAIATDSND